MIGEKRMADKTEGTCTGCGFPYQLRKDGTVRKHLSRVGPGECSGSRAEPKMDEAPPEIQTLALLHPAEDPKDETDGKAVPRCAVCERLTSWCRCESVPETRRPALSQVATDSQRPESAAADPFTTPGAAPATVADETVSGQPEPNRDRWGRYLMWMPDGREAMTRTTTFAKSCSDTYALSEWEQRLTAIGLTMRPDLLALAHGKDVKQDRKELNGLVADAKAAAGQKVAANLGTAVHSLTERLDARQLKMEDVPAAQRQHVQAYASLRRGHSLLTVRDWIERTTCVNAGGEMVAGTLDRIFQLPNGDLVIGDLKTGSDLSYGWGEIAVQLAVYAHGVNENGLYDWNTDTWTTLDSPVRTDYALVVHVPVDPRSPKEPAVYRVDLREGWAAAELCARVRAWRKHKSLAAPLTYVGLPEAPPAVVPTAVVSADNAWSQKWERIIETFRTADSRDRLMQLYGFAYEGLADRDDRHDLLAQLTEVGRARLAELQG